MVFISCIRIFIIFILIIYQFYLSKNIYFGWQKIFIKHLPTALPPLTKSSFDQEDGVTTLDPETVTQLMSEAKRIFEQLGPNKGVSNI